MRYGVLGPLVASDVGRECSPSAPRLRTVLALLLARANQVVSADDVMTELWGDRLPPSAANSVQVFVARLRGLLAPDATPQAPNQVLLTCGSGYRLRVRPEQFDLERFDGLARAGEAALVSGDATTAAGTLREALALWRGEPFGNVEKGEVLHMHALRMDERRIRTVERRVEADLRLGRHAELVPELNTLAADHPVREELHGQLMLALYRAGRQAEAIAAYRRLRDRLVGELAVEPTAAVQRLHRAILSGDPSVDAPRAPVPAGNGRGDARDRTTTTGGDGRPVAACAQLPPDIADFTGRSRAIGQLEAPLVAVRGDEHTAVPVVAVTGEAGVGKTTLAVHCAHRLRPRYPDGQLYLNLRGGDPPALDPARALGRLLRGLGIDGTAVPETVEERIDVFRSRTADRRLLLVLDDAACEDQIRPLLPGGPRCGVVVTSRRRLSGLEGAVRVDLEMFSGHEAAALLERVAGPERLASDSRGVAQVAELCGRLPLAVRVAGAKLAARPHWSVSELAARLADERRRLSELIVGDLDVRASIAVSYAGRSERERRAFRLLGLLTMPDFPAWPAAALLGVDSDTGEALLEGLVDAHLVQVAGRDPVGQVRYQLHDLVRVFAAERMAAEEPAGSRRAAEERVLAGYRDLARAADEVLRPGQRSVLAEDPAANRWPADARVRALAVGDPAGWFAAERLNLVACVQRARAAGLSQLCCDLSGNLFGFLEMRTHWDDWSVVADLALAAAREARDQPAEARALSAHGYLRWDQGRPQQAIPYQQDSLALLDGVTHRRDRANVLVDLAAAHVSAGQAEPAIECLDRAQPVFRRLGDRRGEAFAAHMRGRAHRDRGRPGAATRCFRRSVALFGSLRDRRWEAYSLVCLGSLLRARGRRGEAARRIRESLSALRSLHDSRWEAYALRVLGGICLDQRRPEEARSHYLQALGIVRQIGASFGEAHSLLGLGDACRAQNRLAEAGVHLRQSLATFRQLGYRRGEAVALLSLGNLARAEHRHDESLRRLERSLGLCRRAGLALWEGRVLTSVGETLAAMGRTAEARQRWHEAGALLRGAASPEADRVDRLVRGLPGR